MSALAIVERERLDALEAVVARGLKTFVAVGTALAEIRDRRLYRATYPTFERYLDARWGMSRANGYRLIDGARVAALVSPIGDIPNEAQARELTPVLRDEGEHAVIDVYRELRAEYGDQVTAERVKRLVRRRLDRVGRETARVERLATATAVFGNVDVRHGDFRDVLDDVAGQVDAIVCDPPYERRWIEADGADFARAARRMLRPNGTLVVMFGQLLHYELKARLDAELDHRWTAIYLMPGSRSRMFHPRVATGWKPILVYRHPDADERPEFLLEDVFTSQARDKDHHHWGQSESGTAALVEAFSRPGGLVCDPFLGGGTTAVVCRDLGRRFVGCDMDAAAVATTCARLDAKEDAA